MLQWWSDRSATSGIPLRPLSGLRCNCTGGWYHPVSPCITLYHCNTGGWYHPAITGTLGFRMPRPVRHNCSAGYCLPPNKMGMMRRSPCFLCSVKVCGGSRFHFWRSIEHFPEQCCMRAEYLNGEVRRWVKCAEMCGEKRSGWQAGTICHEAGAASRSAYPIWSSATLPIWRVGSVGTPP